MLFRSGEDNNIVKYSVFVVHYILQHGENCVNTSVFARHWHKNTVNTVIFATRGKMHRKFRGFWLPRRKKHRYLHCFVVEVDNASDHTTAPHGTKGSAGI